MKYGKEFQQILADPSFPEDWKSSAIEYRRVSSIILPAWSICLKSLEGYRAEVRVQLKKLIKDVVAELSGMGLSPNVLHKLLVTEEENHYQSATCATATSFSSALETSPARGKLMREIPVTYWNSSSKVMSPPYYLRARFLLPRRSPLGGSRRSLWILYWTSGRMMRRLERIPETLKLDLIPFLFNHITESSACVYSPTRLGDGNFLRTHEARRRDGAHENPK